MEEDDEGVVLLLEVVVMRGEREGEAEEDAGAVRSMVDRVKVTVLGSSMSVVRDRVGS